MNKKTRARKAVKIAGECLSAIGIDRRWKPLRRKELEEALKYLQSQH